MARKTFYIENSKAEKVNGYEVEAGIFSTQKRNPEDTSFMFAYLAISNRPDVFCLRTRNIPQARNPETRNKFIREVIDKFVIESSDIGLPHSKNILDAIYNKCDSLILKMVEPYSIT